VALARWISARHLQEFELKEGSGLFVLADDSGLEVDELDSAPGVYSARFAALDGGDEGNSPDAANNAKLLKLLKNVRTERRTARFRCVIALTPVLPIARQTASPVCDADEFEMQTQLFDGTCEGRISYVPSGDGGFGYDPLFVPVGYQESFAQLGEAVKGRISHRAKALAALREKIKVKSVA
jgi:XTP/dITP diphosphohydrolase